MVLNSIHVITVLRFFPRKGRAHPNSPVEVKVRHEKGQHVQPHIVCKSAVWLVDAAEVVEVSSLPEGACLVRVAKVNRWLSGDEEETVRDTELAGDIARVLSSCRREGG